MKMKKGHVSHTLKKTTNISIYSRSSNKNKSNSNYNIHDPAEATIGSAALPPPPRFKGSLETGHNDDGGGGGGGGGGSDHQQQHSLPLDLSGELESVMPLHSSPSYPICDHMTD